MEIMEQNSFKTQNEEEINQIMRLLEENFQFKFIWNTYKKEQRPFTSQIEQKQFKGHDFGDEGSIDKQYNWVTKVASFSELKTFLQNSARCINSRNNQTWMNEIEDIIVDVLGKNDYYNLEESLTMLRRMEEKNKTSRHHLVQRTISLKLHDLLDEPTIMENSIIQIYNDLYIADPEILPEGRRCSAVNFYKFCYYQDNSRRIRIHYILPSNGKSEYPHAHYGNSGSIILAGSMVNQHVAVHKAENAESANFGLYTLFREEFKSVVQRSKKLLTRKFYAYFNLISSHLYKSGNYYFLPCPKDAIIDEPTTNDYLTFHRIDTEYYAITLFTQTLDRHMTHTTREINDCEVVKTATIKEEPALLTEDAYIEITKIDKLIHENLTKLTHNSSS